MSDAQNQARAVLEGPDIHRALTRIAHEILERTRGAGSVVLLGIPTRGATLAHRIAGRIAQFEGIKVPVGAIDITMYRDDLRLRPARPLGRTELPRTAWTAGPSSSWTTSSSPGARCAPRSTR